MNKTVLSTALAAGLCATSAVQAEIGISLNVGPILVSPDSGESELDQDATLSVGVDSNTQLGLIFDIPINDNIVVEVVAATPFEHDITGETGLAGAATSEIGSTKHLPPTVFAQYHFGRPDAVFRPFVGAGLNYTIFFEEETGTGLRNALAGLGVTADQDVDVELDDSVGIALQGGFNYMLSEDWTVNAMLSWIDINTDADIKVDGVSKLTSEVEIDPLVFFIGAKFDF